MTAVDTTSIEAVVAAIYRSISFEPGQRPDWATEREILAPDVRLVRNSDSGREVFDLDGYIRNFEAMIADGRLPSFYEKEIASRIDRYGDIAHCFSTYEARLTPGSPDVLFRGINSIQLLRTGGRWRIVSLIWQREGPATPLPDRYLRASS